MRREGFRRFLRIERRRPAGETAPPAEPPERFDALESAHPAAPPAARAAEPPELQRFRMQESGLELDRGGDEQPFRRCCRCGADANRLAQACAGCGADLRTTEQGEFNARLWAARRKEAEVDALREAARKVAAAAAQEQDAARRRALAETLAAEIGRQERQRLEREGLGGGYGDAQPWGARLLQRIEDPRRRLQVGLGAAAALALVFVLGLGTGHVSLVLLATGVGAALLLPPRFFRVGRDRSPW